MTTHTFIPVLGKRLRVTALDECGNVNAAGTADSNLTTDGFISVQISTEVESGPEIITRKADGSLCVNMKLSDSLKRLTVEIEFCGVNPSLLSFVSNAEPYADYNDDVAGFTVAEGTIEKWFALELWTGLSSAACEPGVDFAGGYLLLPFVVAGVLGDISVDGEKAVTFSLKGSYTKGGNLWGVGPYNVVLDDSSDPAPLPTALDSFDHLLLIDTSLAPPPAADAPGLMPPYITSLSVVTGAAAGGTATVITGAGFTGATAVKFDTATGSAFSVVNDTTINVTSPAHAAGAVDVTVVKAGGNAVKVAAFTYT